MATFKLRENLTEEQRDRLISLIRFHLPPTIDWVECKNGRSDKGIHYVFDSFSCYCKCELEHQLFEKYFERVL